MVIVQISLTLYLDKETRIWLFEKIANYGLIEIDPKKNYLNLHN